MDRLKLAASISAALICSNLGGMVAAQSVYEMGRPLPPRPVHQPTYMLRHGVIAGFQVPAFGSGYIHTYVTFQVRAPGNHLYQMLWTYFGPNDQFIPRIGSICQVAFHYETRVELENRPELEIDFSRPHMIVDEWDCDTGRAGQDRP